MANKRNENGIIVARGLFLPAENQPEKLIWAAKVLASPSPTFDDFCDALQTSEEIARERLPGASWEEADTAMLRLVKALGLDYRQVLVTVPLFRRTIEKVAKKRKKSGGDLER